jgi:hypothetical protein
VSTYKKLNSISMPKILAGLLVLAFLWYITISSFDDGYRNWQLWRHLQDTGVSTEATVLEIATPGRITRMKYSYHATMPDGTGSTVEKWEEVKWSLYQELESRTTVPIRYDPSHPETSMIEGNTTFSGAFSIITPIILCVLSPISLLLIMGGLSKLRKN